MCAFIRRGSHPPLESRLRRRKHHRRAPRIPSRRRRQPSGISRGRRGASSGRRACLRSVAQGARTTAADRRRSAAVRTRAQCAPCAGQRRACTEHLPTPAHLQYNDATKQSHRDNAVKRPARENVNKVLCERCGAHRVVLIAVSVGLC